MVSIHLILPGMMWMLTKRLIWPLTQGLNRLSHDSFLEYPTNPDMHYINLKRLKESVLSKIGVTGKSRCLLILDTTFSPQSQPLGVLGNDFPVIIFNSGSKSLTGGKTTLGTLVGNQNPIAKKLIQSCFNINK